MAETQTAFPDILTRAYHAAYADQLPSFEEFSASLQGVDDPQVIEEMAEYLHQDKFPDSDREEFDKESGLTSYRRELEGPGFLESFFDSFNYSLVKANPKMYGETAEAIGLITGSLELEELGETIQGWAEGLDIGKAPTKKLEDVDSIKGFLGWMAEAGGSGIGSTVAPIVGGVAGGLAGASVGGPVGGTIGAILGSGIVGAPLNMGEVYAQLKQEGVKKEDAATAALVATLPIAALDAIGIEKLLRAVPGSSVFKKALGQRISQVMAGVATGAGTEGVTEAAQSAIREGLAAVMTDNPNVKERLLSVLNEGAAGALTGGAIGGAVNTVATPAGDQLPPTPAAPASVAGGVVPGSEPATAPEPIQPPAPVVAEPGTPIVSAEPAPDTFLPPPSERSMASLMMEEEAKNGTRRKIDPAQVEVGDRVVVDSPAGQPEEGTVSEATENVVRVKNDEGSPIGVYVPGTETALSMYEIVPDQKEIEAQEKEAKKAADDAAKEQQKIADDKAAKKAELDEWQGETGRAQARIEKNPGDLVSIDAMRKLRNDKRFAQLPAEERDKVDDFLLKVREREETAKSPPLPPAPELPTLKSKKTKIVPAKQPPATALASEDKKVKDRAAKQSEMYKWREESARAIGRIEENPDDTVAIESLRKLRKNKRFADVPMSERNRIDDFLLQVRQREDVQKEIAKRPPETDIPAPETDITPLEATDDGVPADSSPAVSAGSDTGAADNVAAPVPTEETEAIDDVGTERPATATPAPVDAAVPAVAVEPAPADTPILESAVTPQPEVIDEPTEREPIEYKPIKTDTVVTSAGQEHPVEYAVVDAASLIPSHDFEGKTNPAYPQEFQPRQRERKSSQVQIQRIAGNIQPRLLGESPTAESGAPIVDATGVVESGNARTIALLEAYKSGKAGKYRDYLDDQGYTTEGVSEPVLVRIRRDELSTSERQTFARESNQPSTQGISRTEQAFMDADAMPANVVGQHEGGDLTLAKNLPFVQAFAQNVVPKTQQSEFSAKGGELSVEGRQRIEAALIAKAYGDHDLVTRLTESVEQGRATIKNAVLDVAPRWAAMREQVAAGELPPRIDQTQAMVDAVGIVARNEKTKIAVSELLEPGMFPDETPEVVGERGDMTRRMLSMFFRNPEKWTGLRAAKDITEGLDLYLEEAQNYDPRMDDMFEGTREPDPNEMLTRARGGDERAGLVEVAVEHGLSQLGDEKSLTREALISRFEGRLADGGSTITRLPKAQQAAILRKDAAALERLRNEGQRPVTAGMAAGAAQAGTAGERPRREGLADERRREADSGSQPRRGSAASRDAADNAEITAELETLIERLAPGVGLETPAQARDRQGRYISGKFTPDIRQDIITVALEGNPAETLRHEVLHALRNAGLFSIPEWKNLQQEAVRKGWLGKYKIRERYPELYIGDTPTGFAIEEAIADAFAAWGTDARGFSSRTARLFARLREFFQRLRHALRLGEFPVSVNSIFENVEIGIIGSRSGALTIGMQPMYRRIEISNDDNPPALESEESEARLVEAEKGIQENVLTAKLAEAWEVMRRNFSRHFPLVDKIPENADLIQKLLHLEAQASAGQDRIANIFKRVVGGLNDGQLRTLTRYLVFKDLLWTSEQGMQVGFGLEGIDQIAIELRKLQARVDASPEIKARYDVRQSELDRLRGEMVGAGVLTKAQARNPHYFRHQVLAYAKIKQAAGQGKKVSSSFWHTREGSEKDINANYMQAEAEWMFKAINDINTMRFLNWLKGSKYDKKPVYVRMAKALNRQNLTAALLGDPDKYKQYKTFNRKIAVAMGRFKSILQSAPQTALDAVPEELQPQLKRILDGEGGRIDEGSGIFGAIGWLANKSQNPSLQDAAQGVLGSIGNRKNFVRKDAIPNQFVNPQSTQQLVKAFGTDADAIWQPDAFDGKTKAVHIFTGKSIPEFMEERMLDAVTDAWDQVMTGEDAGITPQQLEAFLKSIKDQRMLGGPKHEMILDASFAATLNEFHDREAAEGFDAMVRLATGRWKQWTIFNPRRFLKYILNNRVGDLDALLANPSATATMKYVPSAFKELRRFYGDGLPTGSLLEAMDKGVVQSGMTTQEIHSAAEAMMTPGGDITIRAMRDSIASVRLARKYFEKIRGISRLLENTVRYAAYIHYRNQIVTQGKSVDEIGYGATPRWVLEGVSDPLDRAAVMARDALGDYGNISVTGQWARDRTSPFISWMESNTVRYIHLFKNSYLQARDVSAAQGIAAGAVTATSMFARIFMFYGAVQLWNNLFFGDEEDELSSEEQIRLHVHAGRWGGEIKMLRMQGALSDFLGWFGMEDAGAVLTEVQQGRASLTEMLKGIAKAPVNRIAQSINPIYKVPFELGLGSQFFPDVFNPRAIRDPWEHFVRTFSLQNEYSEVAKLLGKPVPTRGYLRSIEQVILYSRDAGEMAYDNIRGTAYEWLSNAKGRDVPARTDSKSNALYLYRKAVRYGDEKAEALAKEFMLENKLYGKSLVRSKKRAHPLGMLSRRDKAEFLATLSPKERDQLTRGAIWYKNTYWGQK